MANRTLKMRIAALALLFIAAQAARLSVAEAQDFAVKQFRQLPNDVSAFIDPVRDLNDEPCALIKVAAPEEFAFSRDGACCATTGFPNLSKATSPTS